MITLLWVTSVIVGLTGMVLTLSNDETDQPKAEGLVRVALFLLVVWFVITIITDIWGKL